MAGAGRHDARQLAFSTAAAAPRPAITMLSWRVAPTTLSRELSTGFTPAR